MNWTQLHAMLWLRWRLTWNQWRRGGRVGAVVTIIVLVIGIVLAVAGAVGGLGGRCLRAVAGVAAWSPCWSGTVSVAVFLMFWGHGASRGIAALRDL